MKLSIVIPSNRATLSTCARLFEYCSWGSKDIQVVIRDNSCDPKKRDLLSRIEAENCDIIFTDYCLAWQNTQEAFKLARGDFVVGFGDDDFCEHKAIDMVLHLIEQHGDDHSLTGITGDYLRERARTSEILRYPPLDQLDAVERCRNYILSGDDSNHLVYSVIRREVMSRILDFIMSMPFEMPYRDWLSTLMQVLSGRFLNIGRIIYYYDFSVWETKRKDIHWFEEVGLDQTIHFLYPLYIAYEGCRIIDSPMICGHLSETERQTILRTWYGHWHSVFAKGMPQIEASNHIHTIGTALRFKWINQRNVDFHELLTDLSDFMGLINRERGQSYYSFWSSL
ncbi:hypothetical protein [Telmatospirillum siberiense]|uniref:Glycosyltransferase 2-like domain-containing protein n=1 Tax=Telmatospirillum siberiense TaxID=382514 RepID=A0A2N3Q010_9PROT|nr:hypothetical protein [Telmatospirillum siberiense]PKU25982.1 hypothetical protein CWS72_02230 [Telmatospirillum siberiense]